MGLLSCCSTVNAQQVYPPFVFSQIPQDYQLYARNDKNLATIPIIGTIQDKGWKAVAVSVYREGKLYGYQKVSVQVKNPEDSFSANTTIKSEKAEYNIFIYGFRSEKDSVLITKRINVVAGDFYVIYGDSNGNTQNVIDYYSTNKYIRTFGRYNHEAQRDYLPKDTAWSQNENYYLPRVGAWGTMLQELIADKYNIPVAIITGGGPGMNIDLLTDRQGTGVNPGGVYNSFGYRIKKSGLINNIKGFFIWHGVYELFSKPNPIEYDAKVKKLMGFFKQDFPNVAQYIHFQSAIVRFNLNGDAGASIRESQRMLASVFPKVIPYAVEGLAGYDGVHYTTVGYANCAKEILSIIEPIVYNKPQDSNVLSPNILKAFYVDDTHQKIKIVFQENQLMVAGKDTTVKINGQNTNLTLKKWFFQDGNFSKNIDIQEISTGTNSMVLSNQNGFNAKKLSYLPPFHGAYSEDFPIFIGPYIKNILGRKALSFHAVKIQESLAKPNNFLATSTVSQIKLTWNISQFPVNAQLIIERKLASEDNYKVVSTSKINISDFTDFNLINATNYNYQIKVVSDSSESVYAQVSAKTLEALGTPKLSATVLYNNRIQISCSTILGAETYTLSRRLKSVLSNSTLLNLSKGAVKSLTDSTLTPNQTYVYKVIATRGTNESTSDSIEVTTPALLSKPELSTTILYYNSLKLNWKPIVGAVSYQLERKIAAENYQKIALFDNKTVEFLENNLKENTAYAYRLKAFGDRTESVESEILSQTPAILSTPELTVETVTHDNVKLKWKAIPDANKYVLERQAAGEVTFQKIFETPNLLEFTDVKVKDNSIYNYRLKAFSGNSESNFAKIDLKTSMILSTFSEENSLFKLYPNPASEKLTISFAEPTSGNISFIDLLGKSIFEQNLLKQKSVEINVSAFKKGYYLVLVKTNQELYTQKIIIE